MVAGGLGAAEERAAWPAVVHQCGTFKSGLQDRGFLILRRQTSPPGSPGLNEPNTRFPIFTIFVKNALWSQPLSSERVCVRMCRALLDEERRDQVDEVMVEHFYTSTGDGKVSVFYIHVCVGRGTCALQLVSGNGLWGSFYGGTRGLGTSFFFYPRRCLKSNKKYRKSCYSTLAQQLKVLCPKECQFQVGKCAGEFFLKEIKSWAGGKADQGKLFLSVPV